MFEKIVLEVLKAYQCSPDGSELCSGQTHVERASYSDSHRVDYKTIMNTMAVDWHPGKETYVCKVHRWFLTWDVSINIDFFE